MEPEINKKRLLFIITKSELGGAQQFLARLLSGLDRQRYDCAVAAGSQGGDQLMRTLPADVRYVTVPSIKRDPSVWSDIASVFGIRRLILAERPDILFLASSKAGFNGSLAARLVRRRLPNMKVIYRIGGWTFNDPWPWYKRTFFALLEKASAGYKDYIVVNSGKDLRDARRRGIRPRKDLRMIHNGIDPYLQFPEMAEARQELARFIARRHDMNGAQAILQAKHVTGTIANFYPAKDVLTLIRAAKGFLGDTVTVIIGDGPMHNKILEEVRKLGLERRIVLAGAIPNAWQYLTAFDVFVLPSRKEGFPWVILEAMAARVPVIATSVGAVPEIIENGINGIVVDPQKPERISAAVNTLLKDNRLRQEFSIQAHQTLIKKFSLGAMIDEYERLFSSL